MSQKSHTYIIFENNKKSCNKDYNWTCFFLFLGDCDDDDTNDMDDSEPNSESDSKSEFENESTKPEEDLEELEGSCSLGGDEGGCPPALPLRVGGVLDVVGVTGVLVGGTDQC